MKCIKNNLTNEVRRVSDEHADHLVSFVNKSMGTPLWSFCPKSEWKALRPKDFVNPETLVPKLSQEEKAQRQRSKKDAYKAQKRAARLNQ